LVADLPADDTLSLARRVAAGGFAKA
jgi:hypothetical protein